MRTKVLLNLLLLTGIIFNLNAQQRQSDDGAGNYRSIIPEDKQELLKNIDMYANTQLAFRNDFLNGQYLGSRYTFEQFRLETKGYLHKNIYFRFRYRFTSTFEPQSIDKIIKNVDFAYLVFTLSDHWKLTLGKTYADWGGIEFDLNPIDIYTYSDIIEMADNFLTGAEIHYRASENHSFGFQILNSRTSTFDDIYDTVPNVNASKFPAAFVFNWRGSLWNGKVTTIWSYSYFVEARNYGKNYIALGNKFHSKRFDLSYDYKISNEGLDRTGIISNEIPDSLYNYAVEKTLYRSHWIRATYKFNPKWHISVDAFVDFADWLDDLDPKKNENRFRTVYSVIPTIEFYPWENFDLKFFLGYIGRWYKYSDYAKTRPGLTKTDFNESRIMIGMISPLKFM